MKIRLIQTCIMSSLSHCIFRCSVFRDVILVFFNNLFFNYNSFILVANKYLLTQLKLMVSKVSNLDTRKK